MINQSRINELREEVGEDDLLEVVDIFCEEVEEVLSDLDQAPPPEIPGKLHFLKGSALNIGFDQLSEMCRQQELRLRDTPDAAADIAAIRAAYVAAKSSLNTILSPT